MGMFDYIRAKCPECGANLSGQTKSGPCQLNTYRIQSKMKASEAFLLNGKSLECEQCKNVFVITVEEDPRVDVRIKKVIEDSDQHEDEENY